jgi:hypothetical protein
MPGVMMPRLPAEAGQKPKDKRYRVQMKFWLDDRNPIENQIGNYLLDLKAEKKYHEFLRDAFRLLIDLRHGGVGELLRLFPDIEARLMITRLRNQEDLER